MGHLNLQDLRISTQKSLQETLKLSILEKDRLRTLTQNLCGQWKIPRNPQNTENKHFKNRKRCGGEKNKKQKSPRESVLINLLPNPWRVVPELYFEKPI